MALIVGTVTSAAIAQGNADCAQIGCASQFDPGGDEVSVGILVLLVGIFLIAYGATRGFERLRTA